MPVFPASKLGGTYWPHVVKRGRRLRHAQRLARIFVAWADSRFPTNYSPALLAAGVVAVDDLQRLLTGVVRALLACCPPMAYGTFPKKSDQGKPVIAMSRALNALIYANSVMHFGDDADVFDAADYDEDTRLEAITLNALREVTPGLSASIRSAQKHLRAADKRTSLPNKDAVCKVPADAEPTKVSDSVSRRAWHTALEDAMRLAVNRLDAVVTRYGFHRSVTGTGSDQRKFASACKSIRTMARTQKRFKAHQWLKAATLLQKAADGWLAREMRHHVKGNDQTAQEISLASALAYVFQYATLMKGSERISPAVTRIAYLRDVCHAIASINFDEDTTSKNASAQEQSTFDTVLARMDRRVLPAGLLERWRDTLGDDAVAHGKFINEVATPRPSKGAVPQTVRWARGERIEAYEKFSPRAKTNNRGSFEDVFLNDCLVPLQRLGLAARIPDDIWRRANELEAAERAGGDTRKVRPLTTHIGKKWIVNPLGTALARDADRQGA